MCGLRGDQCRAGLIAMPLLPGEYFIFPYFRAVVFQHLQVESLLIGFYPNKRTVAIFWPSADDDGVIVLTGNRRVHAKSMRVP